MAKNNEAKIKFTAETGEFNDAIKRADSSLKELRSELKLNATQMKGAGESAELLKERQELLQKELKEAASKTEALSDKLEAAKRIFGDNSDEAKKLQTQLNNAKTAEQTIKNEIDKTNEALKKQKVSLEDVSKKAGEVGDALTNAGKKMSVVSGGIVAAGAASVAAFNEVDEGADNAIKATGATGEAAAELEQSYKNVAGAIVGDFGAIGSTLGEVNTRFGLTGKEAEDATGLFMKFSEVTGMDSVSAVQAVSRAMESAGIDSSNYKNVLDSLTTAGQATGISVDTLATSLTDNGATMRAMGYDTNETIAMLAQFEKAGVDGNAVIRGMRTATAKWSKEGLNAKDEFAKLVEGIKNGSVTAGEAYEVFGSKAGTELIDAIKSGRFEYEDMAAVIAGSKGSLESTFDATVDGGYKMELAMQNAKLAFAEVGNTLSTSLAPIVDTASEKLQGFANWWSELDTKSQNTILTIAGIVAAIGPVLLILGQVAKSISAITNVVNIMKNSTILATAATKLQTAAQWLLNAALNANPIALVVIAIVGLIAIFATLWNKCDAFRQFWIDMWEGIKKAFWAVVGWIKENWQAMLLFMVNPLAGVFKYLYDNFEGFRNFVNNVVTAVKNFFVNLWEGIKKTFSNVGSWFRDKFNGAKQGVQNAWSGVKNFFSNIKNGIVNAFSNIKEKLTAPFTKARDAIKGVVDKIKGFFSGMKLSLPKIKLPHFKVTGKLSLNPPSVPKLKIDWYKDGGIMTKPTIFGMNGTSLMAGGEAGPEAILPIDRLQGYIFNAIEKSAQAMDIRSLANAIEDLANRPIDLNINGRNFARATAGDSDSVNGLRTKLGERGLALS